MKLYKIEKNKKYNFIKKQYFVTLYVTLWSYKVWHFLHYIHCSSLYFLHTFFTAFSTIYSEKEDSISIILHSIQCIDNTIIIMIITCLFCFADGSVTTSHLQLFAWSAIWWYFITCLHNIIIHTNIYIHTYSHTRTSTHLHK